MGNGQKDDTYKSLVMRFNIFTLQIQISLSTEYICTFFLSITFIKKHFDVKWTDKGRNGLQPDFQSNEPLII